MGWALLVGAVAPGAASAAPKIGAKDLGKIKVVNEATPVGAGNVVGDQANCPKGSRVISGGVFFTPGVDQAPVPTDVTRIRASVPTVDGKAWYGAGENATGGERTMYVTAHCLLKTKKSSKKIGGDDLAKYKREQNSIGISPNETKGNQATCDDGRVMAGGSFLDNGPGKPDAGNNFVLSQMTTDGNAEFHFAAGRSLVSGPTAVVSRALCLPDTPKKSKKIGSDDLKEFDIEIESIQLLNNQIGGTYSLCKDGERVITGGSFLQTPNGMDTPPSEAAAIAGTSAAGGGNAWFGATRNLSGNTRNLVVLALCLPK